MVEARGPTVGQPLGPTRPSHGSGECTMTSMTPEGEREREETGGGNLDRIWDGMGHVPLKGRIVWLTPQ